MRKVIYALFDDGLQSVYNTFSENEKFEVYSFGIQEKKTVTYCDLSELDNFFKVIKNLPRPDLIFANPPCETFSIASSATYGSGRTGNFYYYYDNLQPIIDFEDWIKGSSMNIKHLSHHQESYFEKLQETRKIHEKLHENTEKIIKLFDVPFAIENPAQSLCFKKFYQNSDELLKLPFFYDNYTYYYAYDFNFTEKPTRIRTNIPISLKPKPSYVASKNLEAERNYNIRSAMPNALIKSIVFQLLKIESER